MKARITVLVLCLCAWAGTQALADANYTVGQYRAYAAKVYRQQDIPAAAKKRLRKMVLHQRSLADKRRVLRLRVEYIRLHRSLLCSNTHPLPCIYQAAARYRVSATWLITCARSEGGLGPFDYKRPNSAGSGAAGNFQFMYTTFADAIRRMGLGAKPWLSARWQALAAAFKFAHGESGEWTGSGC